MREISTALDLKQTYEVINTAKLPSCFAVSELAASAIGAVGSLVAEITQNLNLVTEPPTVQVDQTLASIWFSQSIHPIGWQLPPVWDAIAGDYRTRDGWIKLHTNLPHHRGAALSVLECAANKEDVARSVATWASDDLEQQIHQAGGVAAALRSRNQWVTHPQGMAVADEPLIKWGKSRQGSLHRWKPTLARPLNELRILDLTRVLAGPVSTRALAGFGAQVLRIDPPGWNEPNVVPDITLGKRCAYLDLETDKDRQIFEQLLIEADVLVHGYRPGALDLKGYGKATRQQIAPNLLEVSLDAYGWTGPWAGRRGFDSLVQMSCGIASSGMQWAKSNKPTPLPVQALDHATGYLMAAAVLRLLNRATSSNEIGSGRLSLARTAELLTAYSQSGVSNLSTDPKSDYFSAAEEITPWGPANRLKPALYIDRIPMRWDLPANRLGSGSPRWH